MFRPRVSFRSLRSLALFGSVAVAYCIQWLLWRASARRVFANRWRTVHEANAARLATGFARLGGVYIKLGQVISVLGAFLPEAYPRALGRLQDAAPTRPFADVEPRLRTAWGSDWLRHFESFEREAVAAASLAQVHRARLCDGSEVAVKVLYAGIEARIQSDLRTIHWLSPLVRLLFGFRRMPEALDQLTKMLEGETNLLTEAANVERLRRVLGERADLVIPKVHSTMGTEAVLVMSWERGHKLSHAQALATAGIDTRAIANTLVDCYLTMLLEHRVFHADPHPGNLLARDGQLVLLDFGAVAEVSESLVAGLKRVIIGGLARNADQVLAGVEEMGFVAEDGNRELLREVGLQYLQTLASMRVESLKSLTREELRQLSGAEQLRGRLRAVASSIHYPEGYFYLERTLLLLFGVVAELVPDKGLLGVAAPYASRLLLRSYSRNTAAVATKPVAAPTV